MRESVRAVCIIIVLAAATTAYVVWTEDRPNEVTWWLRVISPILAIAALGFVIRQLLKRDAVPDYLEKVAGEYFNRGGFCFALLAESVEGVAFVKCFFQNQRDQPCVGRIALRPSRGFFLGREEIELITFEMDCEPAAFGVARIAIPVPEKIQGTQQSFDVGASVKFPEGKGREIRIGEGISVPSNSNFGDAFGTALTVAGAATGQLVLSSPAKVTMVLPDNVADSIRERVEPDVKTVWKLGDAPLDINTLRKVKRPGSLLT